MACRIKPNKIWLTVEDPYTTPNAHENTVIMLFATAGLMLVGLLCILAKACRREAASDFLHLFFFLLGAGGYACAGIAGAAYTAGPNAVLLCARLLLVASWMGLLVSCCFLYQSLSPAKLRATVLWTLSTAVALSGLVAAAVGWGTHLEVAMLFVGGMAMLCTLAWYSAWRARRTMSGFVKMLVTGVLSLGFLLVGIMEPFCGAQGHSTCYSSCAGSYGMHYLLWSAFSITGHAGIALSQTLMPDPLSTELPWRKKPPSETMPPAPTA
ncbi:unnamed protein product [Symbiodinium natans]|uniref:Uncharacterized protein n=1 Tax=Symbiodinium natans TaxID=878477 RepID=A0A812KI42_9DINO|nr:unnamed protein product [Symbiodinium natans]